MKVLFIGYVWPEPDSSAAGGNILSLIMLFRRQNWQVTFASAAEISPHMADLNALDVAVENITLNCSSFDNFVTALLPDVVVFDRFMIEEQFSWRVEKYCPNALRILQSEDLHFLRHARHEAYKQNRQVLESDLKSDKAKREVASILRSDLSLIISQIEIKLLQEMFGINASLLHYSPFMLANNKGRAALPEFSERRHFICMGSFRHAPNWDSVLWLSQSLWPKIRKRLPDAELHVCGSYPPKKATQLHNPKSGFIVKGWVSDAHEAMRNARVCLAPLRFGAGLKGKLIDAMLSGTPSVTTSVGVEGMSVDSRWAGFVEDDEDLFVDKAIVLYQQQTEWQEKQDIGDDILKQQFDAEKIGEGIIERILTLQRNLHQNRLSNFTGSMLRHHTMKAAQYMSQWIEQKNKAQS